MPGRAAASMTVPALALLLLALLAPLAHAHAGEAHAFGAPGEPVWTTYVLPSTLADAPNAGEPTIGVSWNNDHLFFQAYASTYKAVFAADGMVEWSDVTPAFTHQNSGVVGTQPNLDPMLLVDRVSNRVYAGGLLPACSLMGLSDDDGATWTPSGNMCTGTQFDHQSIGSGPYPSGAAPRDAVFPRATYYCGQGQLVSVPLGPGVGNPGAACTASLDGGRTWQPPTQVTGGCGSFHGHIRVSEATGFVAVPFGKCPDKPGFAYTTDNGLTWPSRIIQQAPVGDLVGFDPAVAFSKSGWLWYANANELGIHVGLSKDNGLTWEKLGAANGTREGSTYLDLGALYQDPVTAAPIHFATFTNAEAGDDDRAAVTFLGTTDPTATHPYDCGEKGAANVWHYYVATTFDTGASWTVQRLTEDPVQIGGIWDGGGGQPCRNLLDFADLAMDSKGRLVIGFADGCISKCAAKYRDFVNGTGEAPTSSDSRDSYGTVLRQATGRGLLSAYDVAGEPAATPSPSSSSAAAAPGPGLALVAAAVVVAVAASRRR